MRIKTNEAMTYRLTQWRVHSACQWHGGTAATTVDMVGVDSARHVCKPSQLAPGRTHEPATSYPTSHGISSRISDADAPVTNYY